MKTNTDIFPVIRRILRPLARLLLKRGISYGIFAEAAKSAFIDAAAKDLAIPSKKQTTSRISTMTGLSRKEVHRLQSEDETQRIASLHKMNRAARVINGWLSDDNYLDENAEPLALPFEQGEVSFTSLVKQYSGDIPARTIADELTRTGAIESNSQGELKLVKQAYIADGQDGTALKLLADDVAELMTTIEHNIEQQDNRHKRYQRKVYYDNLPKDKAAELKQFIEAQAQQCLLSINQELAKYDRDKHPELPAGEAIKLGLGIHYIEEEES